MHPNKLLERVRRGEPAFGPELWTGNPEVLELMGKFPFQWVMLDVEISPYASYETVANLCRVADLVGLTPIAGIPASDPVQIGKLLDLGVMGFVIAHTITAEDAARAVRSAKYPPLGRRSGAPPMRGAGLDFAAVGWPERADWLNHEIAVIGKIEDVEALDNLDGILSTGIDGLFIGAFDLSHSIARKLDVPELRGQVSDPRVLEARDRVFSKCLEYGKFGGGELEQLTAQRGAAARQAVTDLVPKGVLMYAIDSDLACLRDAYDRFVQHLGL